MQTSPWVQASPSSQGPPVVGLQVPHAMHGPAQAVAQQTSPVQKPLSQSDGAVQGRPSASWANSSALLKAGSPPPATRTCPLESTLAVCQ